MKRVLVVEDEYGIRDLVALNLKLAGYEVTGVGSAEAALEEYRKSPEEFDVALLDIMLPGMSGLSLCDIIRRENPRIGIIMLTAKTQEQDKIDGLSLGADDYVTKPFSVAELTARVDAVYRRTLTSVRDASGEYISGDFVMNPSTRTVTKGGKPLELTQVEYQIMELFFKNPGAALSRDRILRSVWGEGYFGDIKIVDVNICRLRGKVEDDGEPKHIATVWGYGYRWNA